MTHLMPQELDVWYLLPAIRKELVKIFIKKYSLPQKQAAKILGITESAVSQYLKSKRASELKFQKDAKAEIEKTAALIIKDNKNTTSYIYNLSMKLRNKKCLCKIHKQHDKSVSCDCNMCDYC